MDENHPPMMLCSAEHPRFRRWKRWLQNASARRNAAFAPLDGVHLLQSLLDRRGLPYEVVVSEAAIHDAEIAACLNRLPKKLITVMKEVLFRRLSPCLTTAGLLSWCEIPRYSATVWTSAPLLILLDRVQDPGNVGSIIRTAAASGATAILLSKHCADPWSLKVLRAAMGAHFSVPVLKNVELTDVLSQYSGTCIVTDSHAEQSLYDQRLKLPIAWLFGNEGNGVESTLKVQRTTALKIPIQQGMESLNVAAAAAVCLFETARQWQSGAVKLTYKTLEK